MSDISDTCNSNAGKTVLIADDISGIRKVLSLICKSEGCTVYTVENGQQALDHYLRQMPDLILTDNDMSPGMGGMELLRQIRKHGNGVPVVLVSGDVYLQREAVRQMGFADFIPKPFGPKEIIDCIREYLQSE